jgi:hypothetical protein
MQWIIMKLLAGVTPLGATEAAESAIHKNLRAYVRRLGSGDGRSGRKTVQGAGNLLRDAERVLITEIAAPSQGGSLALDGRRPQVGSGRSRK